MIKENKKMSLYNMVHGYNAACLFLMPMLGRKQEEWPRFRDCFLSPDEKHIDIFTRVGGNNRNCGFGEEELYEDPLFVETFDYDEDNTFATYRFNVPDKWKEDFEYIAKGEYDKISDEYVDEVRKFYPLLNSKGFIDIAFERKAK